VVEEQSEKKQKPIVSTLFSELNTFSIILFSVYVIFLYFVMENWSIVQSFFMYFDNHSLLAVTLKNSIESIVISPNIPNISIFIAIVAVFSHLSQKIKVEGHVFFDNEGIEGKYFQSLFTTLNIISFIIVPIFAFFLFYCQSYFELFFDIVLIIFNYLISAKILTNWGKIVNNYDNLVNFKSSYNVASQFREVLANSIIFLIVISSLYLLFLANFNLISIIFIEISFFIAYFIFCSVTHNLEGPVDIFLIDCQTIFRDAYIFEDSPYKGHLFAVLKNDIKKKIIKSSILYIEPSDTKRTDLIESIKEVE